MGSPSCFWPPYFHPPPPRFRPPYSHPPPPRFRPSYFHQPPPRFQPPYSHPPCPRFQPLFPLSLLRKPLRIPLSKPKPRKDKESASGEAAACNPRPQSQKDNWDEESSSREDGEEDMVASCVQLRLLHLLLGVRQQNRDILNELSQLKVVTEVHDDRLGQLEALGARAAPAPEAVARPVVLSRLPATTLEELMAAEEAVQDEAVAAALAMEIADIMGIEDFAASNGWMDRIRLRHGISYRQLNGKATSMNPADIENWISLLPGIVNAYAPRDVYNADELGLFFKVQPTKSLNLKGESCHSGKVNKDQVTMLLCCNEDGTEMTKLWMIWKWKNPTCLKNLARLPCVYKHNTKASMTSSLFEVFLRYLDGRLGCKHRKGLLFLDNCSAHPKDTSFLRNLRVVFLPANTTSHLQPLDAGIIKNVKHLYRKCIVRRFLARVSPASSRVEDPDPCETEDDDMDEEPRSTGAELAFSNFVAVDDDVPTCNPQTVADIVAELRQGQVTRDEHNDNKDEDEPETPPRATFTQAIAALDVLRSYFATKDNPAAEGGLKTLQTELFLPKGQGARQQKLTDVFGR
ncbi:tigger transposable element-derived protein 6-like [Ixodes scapularis]